MAGTLTLSTLSDGTNSTSSTNCIQGSAKAWVKFDGTTTPPTIRGSYNFSSVTRSSTGIFTLNFTNAMVDTNYAVVIGVAKDNTTNDGNFFATVGCSTVTPTTTTVPLTTTQGYGGSLSNSATNCVTIFR